MCPVEVHQNGYLEARASLKAGSTDAMVLEDVALRHSCGPVRVVRGISNEDEV